MRGFELRRPTNAEMRRFGRLARRLTVGRFSRVWIATIALFLISGAVSPGTLASSHLMLILQVASFLGIAAVGQTLVILTGGIDLSVAGVVTIADLVSAGVMNGRNSMILPGLALVLAIGALAGFVNGFFVTKVHVTPLIATLAMNGVLFGAALIYSNGAPHGAIPGSLSVIGQGHVGGFPVSAIIWIAITVVALLSIRRSVFGRRLTAVGANPRAAYLAGTSVDRVVMMSYILAGLASAAAGLLLTAFVGLPSLGIGDPYLLNSIAAVVVGGTALTGGVGSVAASAGGALFMTQLLSLTDTLSVSTGFQFVIEGGIVIASTAFNMRQTPGLGEAPRRRWRRVSPLPVELEQDLAARAGATGYD